MIEHNPVIEVVYGIYMNIPQLFISHRIHGAAIYGNIYHQ